MRATVLRSRKSTRVKYALLRRILECFLLLLLQVRATANDPRGVAANTLFISIGSSPSHFHLRQSIRTAIRPHLTLESVIVARYLFFSENDDTDVLKKEFEKERDLHFQYIASGYHNFLQRGLYQLKWALSNIKFNYYLRIDDDGVLCVAKLLYQLRFVPQTRFFWGKYWCKSSSRADENFMLFSRDLAATCVDIFEILPVNNQSTFALNWGFYAFRMQNVVIFDDRTQICAQQEYLTHYMRYEYNATFNILYENFCDAYLWAHHVRDARVIQAVARGEAYSKVKPLPPILPPSETCVANNSYYQFQRKEFQELF